MNAAIDLGSQSALLTVLDGDGRVLVDEARAVGLGRGLGPGGFLAPERVERALEVLGAFARTAARLGVPPERVQAAATSALRRARDRGAFLRRVREATGLELRVLDGADEARLTFLGATWGQPADQDLLVVDVGGGSTEVVAGRGERIEAVHSVEVGAVRLLDAHLAGDRVAPAALEAARRAARAALKGLPPRSADRVLAVGGTATTAAALELGLAAWDPRAVHGHVLDRDAIARWIRRLSEADRAGRRRLVAVDPGRSDVLLGGLICLDAALDALGAHQAAVSVRGLRYGLLRDGGAPCPREP